MRCVYLVECGTHAGVAAGVWPCHTSERVGGFLEPEYVRTLSDGSRLAYLYPAGYRRKNHPERLLIRVIAYTLGDPARNGSLEVHRVVTTLLNPRIARALAVVIASHER